jgi:hypothetical protein
LATLSTRYCKTLTNGGMIPPLAKHC